MFTKDKVEKVITTLQSTVKYFVSEAHLQMSFTLEAYKQFGEFFDFYPEFPIIGTNKRDEIDLVIFDKSSEEKTFIEFKHKTKNISKQAKKIKPLKVTTINGIEFEPSNMCAQDLGRFDCWSDIERLERHKKSGDATNAFFIFITNEDLYWKKDGTSGYGTNFSMMPGEHNITNKVWESWDDEAQSVSDKIKKGIKAERNRKISTQAYSGNNVFVYNPFQNKIKDKKYSEYKCLIVDIL